MSARLLRSDFRAVDLGASVALSLAVFASAGLALGAAAATKPGIVPSIEPMAEHAVRVIPILDARVEASAPLLKLGGQRDASKLPDRAVRPTPKARVEERAVVSAKASKAPEDAPAPEVKMATPEAKPPPPEAEVAKQVDTPAIMVPDAGAPANVDQVGHSDGVKEGTETDPLKARAVDLYRAKIAAWFSSRFRVTGSGLAREDLLKYRVSASISVGDDRTVSGFSISGSGNAAFDAAARRALDAARGQALPPPPENYPDVAQSRISVTFVCRENRCD